MISPIFVEWSVVVLFALMFIAYLLYKMKED